MNCIFVKNSTNIFLLLICTDFKEITLRNHYLYFKMGWVFGTSQHDSGIILKLIRQLLLIGGKKGETLCRHVYKVIEVLLESNFSSENNDWKDYMYVFPYPYFPKYFWIRGSALKCLLFWDFWQTTLLHSTLEQDSHHECVVGFPGLLNYCICNYNTYTSPEEFMNQI